MSYCRVFSFWDWKGSIPGLALPSEKSVMKMQPGHSGVGIWFQVDLLATTWQKMLPPRFTSGSQARCQCLSTSHFVRIAPLYTRPLRKLSCVRSQK